MHSSVRDMTFSFPLFTSEKIRVKMKEMFYLFWYIKKYIINLLIWCMICHDKDYMSEKALFENYWVLSVAEIAHSSEIKFVSN